MMAWHAPHAAICVESSLMENPMRRLSRNDIIIHGLNTPLTGWGMNVDGRPRLASFPAIKDDLTRESQERARVQRLRIITRHPDRYTDFILEGWSVDVMVHASAGSRQDCVHR